MTRPIVLQPVDKLSAGAKFACCLKRVGTLGAGTNLRLECERSDARVLPAIDATKLLPDALRPRLKTFDLFTHSGAHLGRKDCVRHPPVMFNGVEQAIVEEPTNYFDSNLLIKLGKDGPRATLSVRLPPAGPAS